MKRRSFFGTVAGLALGALGVKAAEPKGMMVGLTSGKRLRGETRTVVVFDEHSFCYQDMVRLLETRQKTLSPKDLAHIFRLKE